MPEFKGDFVSKSRMQDRYLDIKRRMSELGFTGRFSPDAMDISEFLLDQVSTLSMSFKQVQDKESRLASDLALAQAQLFPLRKENARLARDNHNLHGKKLRNLCS
jgi:hypothetical protein